MADAGSSLIFAGKLLPLVLLPLGLSLTLLLVAGVFSLWRWRKIAFSCATVAVVNLWLCSTPAVADWLTYTLESQFPPRTLAQTPKADVAIILGGVVGQPVPPRVEPNLTERIDRVLHAVRLFRAKKVTRILVTGGNLSWLPSVKAEAELIRELLVSWGVPESAIGIAGASRNTRENALEVLEMRKRSPFTSALLVTSAAHMPRAMAVFRKAGLPVVAATTDVLIVKGSSAHIRLWLPDAEALQMTTAALREWMGIFAYRLLGYS